MQRFYTDVAINIFPSISDWLSGIVSLLNIHSEIKCKQQKHNRFSDMFKTNLMRSSLQNRMYESIYTYLVYMCVCCVYVYVRVCVCVQ